MDSSTNWYKQAVIYRLDPGPLEDAEADLAYLRSLNITAVCLGCILPPDSLTDVSEDAGGRGAFASFLKTAHRLGLRVLMSFPLLNTSIDHPWFAQCEERDKHYKDYYIFRKTQKKDGTLPSNWKGPDGESVWSFSETRGEYYFHTYAENLPDLNWDSPRLRSDMRAALRWWLERGLDGFVFEDITLISKTKGFPDAFLPWPKPRGINRYCHGPRVHEFLSELTRPIMTHYDALALGVAPFTGLNKVLEYITPASSPEMDMVLLPSLESDSIRRRKTELAAYFSLIQNKARAAMKRPEGLKCETPEQAMGLAAAYLFLPGTPVLNDGEEELCPDFYQDAIYYRRTLPCVEMGDVKFLSLTDENVFAYTRNIKSQSLLVLVSLTSRAIKFNAPKELDLFRGELILASHGDYANGNQIVTQPYETRVYLFQKRRTAPEEWTPEE